LECDLPYDHDVGARHYKELIVWQLADQLRREVYRLLKRPQAARDLKFRDQLADAVASIPSNLAEGFGRTGRADFARFVVYASGGVNEVTERLEDGVLREHWPHADVAATLNLAEHLKRALAGLLRHLRHPRR
jgi:four helix bundle protein